jgi:PAS domain S-box-containing protein
MDTIEAHFRTLIEHTPIGIRVSRGGVILYANHPYLKMFGFERLDEIAGKPITDHWSPEWRALVCERAGQRSRDLPSPTEYEAVALRKEGFQFPAQVIVTTVELPDGQATVEFISDLTERKRADEALQQRNRYIETILEEAPIGFAVHTIDDGVGRFVSARFEEIYGVTRGEIDSHFTFFDNVWRYDPVFREKIRQRVVADMMSGDPSRMHWENVPVRSATGETRYITAMNIPLPDQNLMVSTVQDVTKHVRAEAALRESEALYRLLAEKITDIIWILDVEALRFRYISPSVKWLLGYTAEEVIEQGWIAAVFTSESAQSATRALRDRMEGFKQGAPAVYTDNVELTRRDGSAVWVEFTSHYVLNEDNSHVEVYGVSRDISERKRAEAERQRLWEELSQVQKMESVGRLAGGIAHDFNNVLADITIQLDSATARDPHMKSVFDELRADAELASSLIQQLLAFSRRSVMKVRPLDLNHVAANMLKMLGRMLGGDIDLRLERSQGLAGVEADVGMLEQVILNLAVNARDAMPNGGIFTMRIGVVVVGEEVVRLRPDVHAGRFVCLSVSDSGCGMDEETLGHLFEPFFTTKEADKGSGLGLSTIYGIVSQHRGWVEADSQVGRGSTFRVFLPATDRIMVDVGKPVEGALVGGNETILLVDDFARLRERVAKSLRALGYAVLEAGSGKEAIHKWQERRDEIDMLLSDISLPGGLNGIQLADRLLASKHDLKIVFSSGYGTTIVEDERVAAGMVFLEKPCRLDVMARTIRDCLDRHC